MTERTLWAEPAGAYAILALLALGAFGATLAPGGWRNRPRRARRLVAVATLLGAALSLLWPQITNHGPLVLDAQASDVAHVAGTWRDGADTLLLARDGTYTCRGTGCTGFGAAGTWGRAPDGSMIAHWRDGHTVPWRVVLYRGRYRLALLPEPNSGATWERQLSFERIAP